MRSGMIAFVALGACSGGATETEIHQESVPTPALGCDYAQPYGNAAHSGIACPAQLGLHVVEQIVQDVDADTEAAGPFGDDNFLQIYEGAPLTSGDYVVIPTHRGLTSFFDRSGETYGVSVAKWSNVLDPDAKLVPLWSADTDWQPTEGLTADTTFVWTFGYVQPLGAVIHGSTLSVEGAHGTLHRFDLATGRALSTVDPLAGTGFSGDPLAATTSLLTVSETGVIYYTITVLPTTLSINSNARASYLVEVTPDNRSRIVEWKQIATAAIGIPGDSRTDESGMCDWSMRFSDTGHPTGPDDVPPRFHCGLQRPAFNTPVSIDPTSGHLIVMSIANGSRRYAYLIDVDPTTLAPLFASSTLGHMLYACGDRFALDNPDNADCLVITANGTRNLGRDQEFNQAVGFQGEDLDLNAIVVAPTGDRSIGGYDGGFRYDFDGFAAQGSTITFDRTGAFRSYNADYGWSASPVVWQHPVLSGPSTGQLTYSYLMDRNIFAPSAKTAEFQIGVAAYDGGWGMEVVSNVREAFPKPPGEGNQARDFVNANLSFTDAGERYAVNGDGHLYAFDQTGRTTDVLLLPNADGTPRSLETVGNFQARDRLGRIYVSYGGFVWIIAGGGNAGPNDPHLQRATATGPGHASRARALRVVRQPAPN